jgi:hypothetical protein
MNLRNCFAVGALIPLVALGAPLACGNDGAESVFDAGETALDPDTGTPVDFGLGDSGGSSRDAALNGDAACATGAIAAERAPVYMQLVVDGSGSMDGLRIVGNAAVYDAAERELDPDVPSARLDLTGQMTLFSGKKWIAMRGALNAFFDDLVGRADPNFAVGMYLFSSLVPKDPALVDVPIAYVDAAHRTRLKTRLAPPNFASGGTPIKPSLDGQLPILKSYTPVAPVKSGGAGLIVLITDGVPSPTATQTQAQANANVLASIAAAKVLGVSTFVIGVGDPAANTASFDEVLLGKLAREGGTEEPGCNINWSDTNLTGKPCHLQVTPGSKTAAQIKQDFVNALDRVRARAISCELKINQSATFSPDKVNVFITTSGVEKSVAKGPVDGWSYDNEAAPTKVILNGKACDDLKSDTASSARLVIGCPSVLEGPR